MNRPLRVAASIWLVLVLVEVTMAGVGMLTVFDLPGTYWRWIERAVYYLAFAGCAMWSARSISRSTWLLHAALAFFAARGAALAWSALVTALTRDHPFTGLPALVLLFALYALVVAAAIVGLLVLLNRLRLAPTRPQ